MLSEPLAVTFDGSSKTLPRVSMGPSGNVYRTADSEFEISILNPGKQKDGRTRVDVLISRRLPDLTPTNVFDDWRNIRNTFGVSYAFDLTKSNASVDIPLLRTALLSLLDTTLQGRIIGGEK